MATYNNPHWLLSHIRNSFISTDDTGLCETVMVSDDLPKQFLQKLNTQKKLNSCTNKDLQIITTATTTTTSTITTTTSLPLNIISDDDITTPILLLSSYYEDDLYCYPGLDQSDDEDLDLASQSFDIPMYPEIGAHRYRSNTAQKLEKMEIARRKAAHIKNIKIDDSTVINKDDDKNNDDILNRLFVRKKIKSNISNNINNHDNHNGNKNNNDNNDNFKNKTNKFGDIIQKMQQQYLQEEQQKIQQEQQQPIQQEQQQKIQQEKQYPIQQEQQQIVSMLNHRIKKNISSRLVEQLLSCPKKPQNRFIQYARFDGTTQTGIPTKNLNIFLSMLPENQRNYPMKICVTATAKIQEVIGFICYKCNIINPEIQLQSVRHYGLYISEDNGEMDMDFPPLDLREPCSKFGFTCLTLAELRPTAHITRVDYRSLSMTSEIEAAGEAAIADVQGLTGQTQSDDMAKMLGHNSMIEAPLYRTFRLCMIIKGIFKTEVQLGISGERLEIDPVQNKNTKFWSRQKAMSYNIESIAYCEIIGQKSNRSILRIWYLTVRPHGIINSSNTSGNIFYPDSPYGHHNQTSNLLLKTSNKQSDLLSGNIVSCSSSSPQHTTNFATNIHNFKYYDFETDNLTAQQIVNKLNFLLEVRSSVTRREFLIAREKKKEKNSSRKLLVK